MAALPFVSNGSVDAESVIVKYNHIKFRINRQVVYTNRFFVFTTTDITFNLIKKQLKI